MTKWSFIDWEGANLQVDKQSFVDVSKDSS